MAGGLSLDDPISTIIAHAVHNLTSIHQARPILLASPAFLPATTTNNNDNDDPEAEEPVLTTIATETDRLLAILQLIDTLPALHTPSVKAHALAIARLAASHSSAVMVMAADSLTNTTATTDPSSNEDSGGGRSVGPGTQSGAQAHLEVLSRHLRDAREELDSLVRGVPVGVRGRAEDGFWVSRAEVWEVLGRVKDVVGGEEMKVVEVLGGRLGVEGEGDDLIKLDDEEAAKLGLPQTTSVRVELWRAGVR
ncbi:hypothetical protein B0J18DRAFT_87094 [Chaetomium sp. MPI-SDFR-AT-0129]|nr:hypothetical protein B0J18DRAFT_87094 [Chaetomium sp. MPI-SDFR-AT-0129]